MAALVQTPIYTIPEFNEAQFKLKQVSDPYALNWFLAHAHIVGTIPNGVADDDKPRVCFPTGEYDEPESGSSVAPNKKVEFQNHISPLSIKGDIVNNQLAAEIGLILHPAVYYKLGNITGDLSKGPVSFEIPETTLYKGKITIQPPAPGSKAGKGGFRAQIDWVGFNIELHVTIPLLKGA